MSEKNIPAFSLKDPQIDVIDEFIDYVLCREFQARASERFAPSTVVNTETGTPYTMPDRISDTASFQRGEFPWVAEIEEAISRLTGFPADHGEPFQVQRYNPGGLYRPHFDYFPPEQPGSASHMRVGGQRVATVILHLSEPVAGGATLFPNLGLRVYPVRGRALFFMNTLPTGAVDPRTLHGGEEVVDGVKWIATKWIRERPYV